MLQIYFSRKLALFATTGCAGVFFMCVFSLNRLTDDTPMLVWGLLWLMMPAMLWGFIVYLKRLLRPPLMLKVDQRGVKIFGYTSRGFISEEGVFLPWNIVSDICYEEREGVGFRTNSTIVCVIKCTLSVDAPFSVEKHSVGYLTQDGKRVVCLDAFNGNITKQAMLDQLKPLWQAARKGEPRVVSQ